MGVVPEDCSFVSNVYIYRLYLVELNLYQICIVPVDYKLVELNLYQMWIVSEDCSLADLNWNQTCIVPQDFISVELTFALLIYVKQMYRSTLL